MEHISIQFYIDKNVLKECHEAIDLFREDLKNKCGSREIDLAIYEYDAMFGDNEIPF